MTVGAAVDRLYRQYLYPPDARPAQALLTSAIDDAVDTVNIGNFIIPEDEELMKNGTVIEVDSELMQTTAFSTLTNDATVLRGIMGTAKAAHVINSLVTLSPPYSRLSAFEAVADNILTLYPKLYTVTTGSVSSMGGGVAPLDDPLAVEVVEVWADGLMSSQDIDARIVDFHPSVGGRALITNVAVGSVWVRFRRRFGDAASESTTLASLGMENRWINIVLAGSAADLLMGRDLSAAHTDWVGAVLEAETIPVGTRSSIAQRLAGYREHLLDLAKKEMRAEYKSKVHMRPADAAVHRGAFG